MLEGKWENMFIAFPWVRAAKFHDMNYEYEKFIINNNIVVAKLFRLPV